MPRTRDKTEAWEEAALALFLASCFLLSFFKDLLPFLEKGLQAAVFVGILFILKQLRDLRLELRYGSGEVFFSTNEEFYSSARRAVLNAEREIRVTYFRENPPTELASIEANEYFAEILRFAEQKGTVRRIIGVPNAAMAEWCRAQAETVAKYPRFHVRVIVTKNQTIEPMSACLIDDSVMYMAFSGPTAQQLGGIREDAPKLVHFHQNRFDQLWAAGTDICAFADHDWFQVSDKNSASPKI